MTLTSFLIGALGYFLIFKAVDFGRTKECKVDLFSNYLFIQWILILLGTVAIYLSMVLKHFN